MSLFDELFGSLRAFKERVSGSATLTTFEFADTNPTNDVDRRFRLLTRALSSEGSSFLPDERDRAKFDAMVSSRSTAALVGAAAPPLVMLAFALAFRTSRSVHVPRFTDAYYSQEKAFNALSGLALGTLASPWAGVQFSNGVETRYVIDTLTSETPLGAEFRRWIQTGRPELMRLIDSDRRLAMIKLAKEDKNRYFFDESKFVPSKHSLIRL